MREAALKLKMYANNVDILNNNIEIRKNILGFMLYSFAGLAFLYVLILGNMVFNIVERKALEKEALTLENQVGHLELSYLSLSKSVDISLSSSMGFKEAKANYATRKSLGSIKLARNEI